MPFNGSGTYTAPAGTWNPAVSGTTIDASVWNALLLDLSQNGLTNCLTRDGQSLPSADLPMGTRKHTGVGDATALTNYAAAGQVVKSSLTTGGTAGGTADALTASLAISPGSYTTGLRLTVEAASSNTGAATININSLGVKAIVQPDGSAPLTAGQIQAGYVLDLFYDGTSFLLLNPYSATASALDALGTGFIGKASGTYVVRTLTGTANEISVTNGDSTTGNPVFSLPSALTFAGKTVTGGTLTGQLIQQPQTTQASGISVSGGGTATINYANGSVVQVTASGNFTLAFSNFPSSVFSAVLIYATNWGGKTITYPAGLQFANGATPPVYTTSGTDWLVLTRDSAGTYSLVLTQQDVKA